MKKKKAMKVGNIMKKWSVLILASFVLVGCQNNQDTDQSSSTSVSETTQQSETVSVEENKATVTVLVDQDKEDEKELTFEEGTTALELLKANFQVEEKDGFVSQINGIAQDDKAGKYWLYYVNGESASVGANDYELKDEDQIEWHLEAMQ